MPRQADTRYTLAGLCAGIALTIPGCGGSDDPAACSGDGCETGTPIVACPPGAPSDPIAINRALLVGDTLTLEVSHTGGCAQHGYALCYSDLSQSSLDSNEFHVMHDAGGDGCDEQIERSLKFDLSAFAKAYENEYGATGGAVQTGYGVYGFGAMNCEMREMVASSQIAQATQSVDTSCQQASDCVRTSIDTSCSAACGAVVSLQGAEELQPLLTEVDEVVCGAAAGACSPIVPPCVPPLEPDCVNGHCAER